MVRGKRNYKVKLLLLRSGYKMAITITAEALCSSKPRKHKPTPKLQQGFFLVRFGVENPTRPVFYGIVPYNTEHERV